MQMSTQARLTCSPTKRRNVVRECNRGSVHNLKVVNRKLPVRGVRKAGVVAFLQSKQGVYRLGGAGVRYRPCGSNAMVVGTCVIKMSIRKATVSGPENMAAASGTRISVSFSGMSVFM